MAVADLFSDFRDGSRLLDLLEVMCSQRMVSVSAKIKNNKRGMNTNKYKSCIK